MRIPQSIKLMLSRGSANTDGSGVADVAIKVPGTVGVSTARTISGGSAWFENQEPGDWVKAEVRDDDNLLGYGVGTVLDTFHDLGVASGNEGWFFMNGEPMHLHPVVNDDPTNLPAGMYLHVIGQKANTATSDTLYINIHWGSRIR